MHYTFTFFILFISFFLINSSPDVIQMHVQNASNLVDCNGKLVDLATNRSHSDYTSIKAALLDFFPVSKVYSCFDS